MCYKKVAQKRPTRRGGRVSDGRSAATPISTHMVAVLLLAHVAALAQSHTITSLPRLTAKPCWKQSSGYLPTGTSRETHLFYWFHEATAQAASKPVVLWLNGGPGCSSLGGMFTELGPLVVGMDGNVTFNPYSWNKLANVLFLEQPAGVGFSYPNLPANDSTTAEDTYHALLAFFAMHPELTGRPFYVMGESYGGHYVPNTVAAIEAGNAALPAASPKKINLVGFAVGNGYTDWQLDFNANVPNTRYHALTSQSRLDAAEKACDGDYARCFWPRKDVTCPAACDAAVQSAVEDATDGSIDIYDIYEDVCLDPGHARLPTQAFTLAHERRKAVGGSSPLHQATRRALQTTISPIFPTCIDASSSAYLNSADVQAAIHVQPATIPKGRWSDCGNVAYEFNYASELPNYERWVQEGRYQMLIYNGDADYILSHMGNSEPRSGSTPEVRSLPSLPVANLVFDPSRGQMRGSTRASSSTRQPSGPSGEARTARWRAILRSMGRHQTRRSPSSPSRAPATWCPRIVRATRSTCSAASWLAEGTRTSPKYPRWSRCARRHE